MNTRRRALRAQRNARAVIRASRARAPYLAQYGVSAESNGGIEALPGFAESLRLLVEGERYSLTDIALMFSVSRERMRQLVSRMGLRAEPSHGAGLKAVRMWDDAQHRFLPVGRGELRRQATVARKDARKAALAARRLERRARLVAITRDLMRELGRRPTLNEIASVFTGREVTGLSEGGGLVAGWWRGSAGSNKGVLADFWHACGLPNAPRGYRSHRRGAA